MSMSCLSVTSRKTRFPVDWRLLFEERIANIGIPLDVFGFFCRFDDFCAYKFVWVSGSLQTSPIVGELAGGGSVAVAVGVSDR